MRIAKFLVALSILVLAFSFAVAHDTSPLQDFCMATDDTTSGVSVAYDPSPLQDFCVATDDTSSGGDVFVFPFGLIHFQFNIGKSPAVAIAALNSQNPGVVTSANTVFGAVPSLNLQLLARAYHLDKNIVANLTKQEWVNPSDLNAYSSYY
ncbi:germin-like protein subfamily 1 member 13 [Jatropha curcas]|uniref:germin-like protein subfamily 1 member 13 n=1 Tax=Jatropha curcas TaxID=180498 RepID=UPI0018949223|nr:germin-like protein subfamily 1 member 13 [Jatropha curcas]